MLLRVKEADHEVRSIVLDDDALVPLLGCLEGLNDRGMPPPPPALLQAALEYFDEQELVSNIYQRRLLPAMTEHRRVGLPISSDAEFLYTSCIIDNDAMGGQGAVVEAARH